MKKNLLWFILGGIIFSSITATAAYVYTARDINYQPSDENWSVNNVQEALTELKTDVSTITNKVEGIERVYKAGEVELVALVSDDSFYKDSNGNYVLSNSDTGRTLLADTSTYKSLYSTDDCLGIFDVDTVIPFRKDKVVVGTCHVTVSTPFSIDLGFEPKYVMFYFYELVEGYDRGGTGVYFNDGTFTKKRCFAFGEANSVVNDNSCLAVSGTTITLRPYSQYRQGDGYYVAIG